jgi:hypothetical protein
MYQRVNDPCHARECSDVPSLASVLSQLQVYSWANELFGHWSHNVFVIGTSSQQNSPLVSIELDQSGDLVLLGSAAAEGEEWGEGMEDGNWVRRGRWELVAVVDAARAVDRIVRSTMKTV